MANGRATLARPAEQVAAAVDVQCQAIADPHVQEDDAVVARVRRDPVDRLDRPRPRHPDAERIVAVTPPLVKRLGFQ